MRFIEFMPLDADGHWENEQVVGQDEIVETINAVYPIEQMPARGAAPADRFRYLDGGGSIGVIPTVTKPFCGDCDRVRLTAEGQFRTCLFETEFDCSTAPPGGTDDEIAAHRGRRRDQVGGPPHQPGELHPPRQVDEPDRRLTTGRIVPGTIVQAGQRLEAGSSATPTSPRISTGPASRRHSHISRSCERPRTAASPLACSRVNVGAVGDRRFRRP